MGLARTKIPWTSYVWNVTTGCNGPNGQPCNYCYARRIAVRFRRNFAPTCHPERLGLPLHTRKPGRVFVDSNGDLFDPAIPDTFLSRVFAVMSIAKEFTFQILTKQPQRMYEYVTNSPIASPEWSECVSSWPLPNVHLGVSITNQPDADERIPLLMQTPAAVHFVSVEPLLSAVNLYALDWTTEARRQLALVGIDYGPDFRATCDGLTGERRDNVIGTAPGWRGLSWVICGGLTPKPVHESRWVETIVAQCQDAKVPIFLKPNLRPIWQGALFQEYPKP